MLQSQWHTEEDFEADLRTFSEIQPDPCVVYDEPPPPSLLEYQARMAANNQSIYDADFQHNEEVTYIISGRGRGGVSKFYKPGAPVYNTTRLEDDDIRRRIRQESGITGYDRMLEEKYARLHKKAEATIFQDAPEHDVGAFVPPYNHCNPKKLTPTIPTTRAESDKSSSPSSSGTNTPISVSNSTTSVDLESGRASTVKSPVKAPPLPLSEILKNGRKKPPPKMGKENMEAVDGAACGTSEVVAKKKSKSKKAVLKNGFHSSSSSNADSVTMNDYWWGKCDSDKSASSNEETSPWKRGDNQLKWDHYQKPKNCFNVHSDEDFPPLN